MNGIDTECSINVKRGHRFKDITGEKYGRLTVIRISGFHPVRKQAQWICQCSCGSENVIVISGKLMNGDTKSCGCLQRERTSRASTTHGLSKTPTWKVWTEMNSRCSNPNSSVYHYYGGRGIKVCERWKDSFESFLLDMGERPSDLYSLERKENDKDYYPDNCKWATKTEQANNRRSNTFLEHNGKKLTIAQWSKETGIKQSAICCRIARGWSVFSTLTKPVRSMSFKCLVVIYCIASLCSCEVNHYLAQSAPDKFVLEDNYQVGGTRSSNRSDGSGYANSYENSFRDFTNLISALLAAYVAGDVAKAREVTSQLASSGATKAQIAKLNADAATQAALINAKSGVLSNAIKAAPQQVPSIPLTGL